MLIATSLHWWLDRSLENMMTTGQVLSLNSFLILLLCVKDIIFYWSWTLGKYNLQAYSRAYKIISFCIVDCYCNFFFVCLGVLVIFLSFLIWPTVLERGGAMYPSFPPQYQRDIAFLREMLLPSHFYLSFSFLFWVTALMQKKGKVK